MRMHTLHTSPARLDDAALRANTYSLLARLLRATPDSELLALLAGIDSGDDSQAPGNSQRSGLGLAWHLLKLSALHANPAALDDEFHDLFIGLGHGEVIPYASWYLTGYLMDRPLAQLRHDLAQLEIVRQEKTSEPEDHLAALCEAMAILINDGSALAVQQTFFRNHLADWVGRCFSDIEQAPAAHFYKAVALLGRQFMELEQAYLDVAET